MTDFWLGGGGAFGGGGGGEVEHGVELGGDAG